MQRWALNCGRSTKKCGVFEPSVRRSTTGQKKAVKPNNSEPCHRKLASSWHAVGHVTSGTWVVVGHVTPRESFQLVMEKMA